MGEIKNTKLVKYIFAFAFMKLQIDIILIDRLLIRLSLPLFRRSQTNLSYNHADALSDDIEDLYVYYNFEEKDEYDEEEEEVIII